MAWLALCEILSSWLVTGSFACQAYLDGSSSHLERVAAGSADDDDGQYVYEEPDTPQEMCSVEVLRGLLEWVKADPCYDVKEEEKEVEKRVSAYLPARHPPRAARRAPIRDTRYAIRAPIRATRYARLRAARPETRGCARRGSDMQGDVAEERKWARDNDGVPPPT